MLEVAVDSVESATNAINGGAHRLEVCSALGLGGLTPSVGLVRLCKRETWEKDIPIFCLIRPRAGDFVYSDAEFELMKEEIKALRMEGADGFVFGILDSENKVQIMSCVNLGYPSSCEEHCERFPALWNHNLNKYLTDIQVDVARNKELVEISNSLPCTFHRAFDFTANWSSSLQAIADIGFKRVLTSGQAPVVITGKEKLSLMVERGKELGLIVMPGSGINESTLPELVTATKAIEYHSSASMVRPRKTTNFSCGPQESHYELKVASSEKVEHMISTLNSLMPSSSPAT